MGLGFNGVPVSEQYRAELGVLYLWVSGRLIAPSDLGVVDGLLAGVRDVEAGGALFGGVRQ